MIMEKNRLKLYQVSEQKKKTIYDAVEEYVSINMISGLMKYLTSFRYGLRSQISGKILKWILYS